MVRVVDKLSEVGIRSCIKRHLLKFPADLVQLGVKFLGRLVQLHELIKGADFELRLVDLSDSMVSWWEYLLAASRSLICQLLYLG